MGFRKTATGQILGYQQEAPGEDDAQGCPPAEEGEEDQDG